MELLPIPDIVRLVRFAIGRLSKSCHLSVEEREDLAQEGIIAALEAARRYDPTRGRKLPHWLLDRITGQLKDSLRRMRGGGIVGGAPIVISLDSAAGAEDGVSEQAPIAAEDNSEEPSMVMDSRPGPEDNAYIEKAMERLDATLRTANRDLLARYYGIDSVGNGLTVSELADELQCSRRRAHGLLRTALKRARIALDWPLRPRKPNSRTV